MRNSQRRILAIAAVMFALSCPIGRTFATSLRVGLDTTGLLGQQGALTFDFIGDAPPDNSVSLSALGGGTVDGMLVTQGNVTGSGPWEFLSGPFFFDELQIAFTFGSTLSFSFTTTDNLVEGLPAAFSFFIFQCDDPDTCIPVPLSGAVPLVTTDGPGDALFDYSIGLGPDALNVYNILGPDNVSITVAQAPEPSPLALLAIGVVALAWRRMPRLVSTGVPRQLKVDAA